MRLIDAEAFLKMEIDRCGSAPLVGTCTSDNEYLSERLKKAPTIEATPVVHGRWIGKPICGNDNCRCSECGSWHHIHANLRGEVMQKYCPNCGAKMDEPVEEDK